MIAIGPLHVGMAIAIGLAVPETGKNAKESDMAKVIVRTIDNRARTPVEVKRLLHEIAFVLRSSRGIRMEILAGPRQRERIPEVTADAASPLACAA